MAFKKKTWVDRMVEYAGRRKITNVTTMAAQIVDVERAEGVVSEEGTAINAVNMNDFEQRTADAFSAVQQDIEGINSDLGGAKFQITDSQLKYWNGSSWVTATPQPNGFLRTASVSGWGQTASIVVGNKYYKSIKWETRDYIHIVNLQLYDNSGNLLISKDLMNKFTGGGGIKNNETGTVDLAQYESYNVDQLIFTATCNMNGGTGYLTISAN